VNDKLLNMLSAGSRVQLRYIARAGVDRVADRVAELRAQGHDILADYDRTLGVVYWRRTATTFDHKDANMMYRAALLLTRNGVALGPEMVRKDARKAITDAGYAGNSERSTGDDSSIGSSESLDHSYKPKNTAKKWGKGRFLCGKDVLQCPTA